jgi:hypothetical protein
MTRTLGSLTLIATLLTLPGCVERTVRIDSHPQGAVVVLNDEEIGVTPVKTAFLWYGDYDLILRKPGYRTLRTSFRLPAPWYQWPPFDLIAETMIASTIRDEHDLPPFELEPDADVPVADIVTRAVDMRTDALQD